MNSLKVKILDDGDIILRKGKREIIFYKSNTFYGYGNLFEGFDHEKFFIHYRSFDRPEFILILCKRHCHLSKDILHLVSCSGVQVLMLLFVRECWACNDGMLFCLCRECRNVVVKEIRNAIIKNPDLFWG